MLTNSYNVIELAFFTLSGPPASIVWSLCIFIKLLGGSFDELDSYQLRFEEISRGGFDGYLWEVTFGDHFESALISKSHASNSKVKTTFSFIS